MKKPSPDNLQETQDILNLSKALRAAQQLVIYRNVLSDPIVSSLLELLDQLDRNSKLTRKAALRISESYADILFSSGRKDCPSAVVWIGFPVARSST